MIPMTTVETLVQDRCSTLLDEAARHRRARQAQDSRPPPGRGNLGWLLVRAGAWLAHAEIVGTDRATVRAARPG